MKSKLILLPLMVMLMSKTFHCAPNDVSFVVSSTETPKEGEKQVIENDKNLVPIIYEMNINSNVSNRFAKTLVESKVRNADTKAKEATFTIVLPERAFISEFVMIIDGKSYKAYVKEKEEAKNIYEQAVSSGQSAAHVAVNARDSNRFTVSVNIEAEAKAAFLLTYEELLERRNEQYELVLNIRPGQIVKNLNVQVNINESRPLVFVRTPSLRSGNEISKNDNKIDPSSSINLLNQTGAIVRFQPDAEKQKEFAKVLGEKESDGLSGQFIVQYEVERDPQGGEILLQDGYFVHFFAPKDIDPLPKNVYFILDTSSSMAGSKIQQLKDAMISILGEIKPEDTVTIVEFNNDAIVWNVDAGISQTIEFSNYTNPFPQIGENGLPGPVPATKETIDKAKKLVSNMQARGGTYMIGGLEVGLYLVKSKIERSTKNNERQPIIIFLTDGQPNIGLYSTSEITDVVTRLNKDGINVPIFSLSFGGGADKAFLRKLSLKNMGFSRHIYDAADASLQLQEFYKQISSPLLSDVKFKYDSEAKEITQIQYPLLFRGSEIVVAGLYNGPKLDAEINALGVKGPIILRPKIEEPVSSLERLWAYLTIKETLEKRDAADDKKELTKKALDLALKYSFVTEVSSLVVVKPNATTAVDTEDASDGESFSGSSIRRKLAHRPSSSSDSLAFSAFIPSPIANRAPAPAYLDTHVVTTPRPTPLLQHSLTWLPSVWNPNNHTLTLPQGMFELGDQSLHVPVGEKCAKTPKGEEGNCTLLKNCPEVFSLLTDFEVYKQFFCPMENKYAGVCCPSPVL